MFGAQKESETKECRCHFAEYQTTDGQIDRWGRLFVETKQKQNVNRADADKLFYKLRNRRYFRLFLPKKISLNATVQGGKRKRIRKCQKKRLTAQIAKNVNG